LPHNAPSDIAARQKLHGSFLGARRRTAVVAVASAFGDYSKRFGADAVVASPDAGYQMKMHAGLFLAVLWTTCHCAFAQSLIVGDASRIPFVDQSGRDAYLKFLEARTHKAYAVCLGGPWAYQSGRDSANAAIAATLDVARKHAKGLPCIVYAVNDQVVTRAYQQKLSPGEFRKVLAGTALDTRAFADENRDAGIPAQRTLREQKLHAPTPTDISGAKVITTDGLRRALAGSGRLVLVDVRPQPRATIPGAHINNAIGIDFRADAERAVEDFLTRVAPDKAAPIVFYCVNWECWLSYNAALRAVAAGYNNVHWYRGGIAAWFEAGLPLEAR
jgi:PQQ-dependent catabolism-associated CXXCW motif protein